MPFWVKTKPRAVCVCHCCKQATELLDAHRRAVRAVHGGDQKCTCACAMCSSGRCKCHLADADSLENEWLCGQPIDYDSVHERDDNQHVQATLQRVRCALGMCTECMDQKNAPFARCPAELAQDDSDVSWREVVKEANLVHTNSGVKELKNVHIKLKHGTLKELRQRLWDCFAGDRLSRKRVCWAGWTQDESFLVHRLVKKWQSSTRDRMLSTLGPEEMLAVIDHAMNCAHRHDEEFSEEHFSPWTSTILPIICHHRDLDGVVKAESHTVLTDDLRHDHSAVQLHLNDCVQHHRVRFAERGRTLRRMFVWSDGCAAQFKTASIFGWLPVFWERTKACGPESRPTLPVLVGFDGERPICMPAADCWAAALANSPPHRPIEIDGIVTSWNFDQSNHGKGPSDADNAGTKGHLAKREEMGVVMPCTMDTAKELLRSMTVSSRHKRKKKKHSVWHRQMVFAPLGSIDRTQAVRVSKSVRGTRSHCRFAVSMGAGRRVNQGVVRMGFLSCACRRCMDVGSESPDCSHRAMTNAHTNKRPSTSMVDKTVTLVGARRGGGGGRRRSMRGLDRRILASTRQHGQFNFCYDDGDGNLRLGAGVSIDVDDDDMFVVSFHAIEVIAGSSDRFVLNPNRADDPIPMDDLLPPTGMCVCVVQQTPRPPRTCMAVVV